MERTKDNDCSCSVPLLSEQEKDDTDYTNKNTNHCKCTTCKCESNEVEQLNLSSVSNPTKKTDLITSEFTVEGMTCSSCVNGIESWVANVNGVSQVTVNLIANLATVKHDPTVVEPEEIRKAIEAMGYKVTTLQRAVEGTATLKVSGMKNEEDLARLSDTLLLRPTSEDGKENPGYGTFKFNLKCPVDSIDYDWETQVAIIKYPPAVLKQRDIIKFINENTNYTASLYKGGNSTSDRYKRKREIRKYKKLFLISLFFAVPAAVMMILMAIPPVMDVLDHTLLYQGLSVKSFIMFLLGTPVQFWLGKGFFVSAGKSLRNKKLTMDSLIVIGTMAAYIYSIISIILGMIESDFMPSDFFEISIFLITFVLLGRWLENLAKGKTSSAITKLLSLKGKSAIVVTIDESSNEPISEEEVDIDLVEKNDVLKVVPGTSIPTDGVIFKGQTSINEAMITGESMPVSKKTGDKVLGGTTNLQGLIYVQAINVGEETAIGKIAKLVEEAQSSKAEIQRIADKISGFFVPVVISLGIIDFVIWISLVEAGVIPPDWLTPGTNAAIFSLLFAISVIVIACPCALGLATPTAVMVGTGVAAKLKILIKGGEVLEQTHRISAIIFDKTGTLTYGKPTLTDYFIVNGSRNAACAEPGSEKKMKKKEFFRLVGSAESGSEHPLARAIVDYAQKINGVVIESPNDFVALPGRGIECNIGKAAVSIGNRRLVEEKGIKVDRSFEEHLQALESQGKTAMIVIVDNNLIGLVAVADVPREEAKNVVKRLQKKNIEVWMVTGDNKRTAQAIAEQLGIDKIFAEVLPQHKKDKVEELQGRGLTVAMVGDGINDSPALAQANVGIAIGAGTDVAIEAAQIVLMRSNLRDVLIAIDISSATYRRIVANFVWAFGYNIAAIPIAGGILYPWTKFVLPPWLAALAMVVSSISVLVSSLLLNLYKPPKKYSGAMENVVIMD